MIADAYLGLDRALLQLEVLLELCSTEVLEDLLLHLPRVLGSPGLAFLVHGLTA